MVKHPGFMDKNEFIAVHNQNIQLIRSIHSILVTQWVRDGKPLEPSETSKRMWTIVSGALDRINRGEDAPHSKK